MTTANKHGRLVKRLGVFAALLMGVILALYLYFWLIDYSTKISISGGERPTFTLSGSGRLVEFILTGPRLRPENSLRSFTAWELRPLEGEGEFVGVIGQIKYGEIPKGCRQIYPEQNLSPPDLLSGKKYLLQVYTNGAPWGQIAFEIKNGKATEIPIN